MYTINPIKPNVKVWREREGRSRGIGAERQVQNVMAAADGADGIERDVLIALEHRVARLARRSWGERGTCRPWS